MHKFLFPGDFREIIRFVRASLVIFLFLFSVTFNHITKLSITLRIPAKFTRHLKLTKIEYYIQSKIELQRQEIGRLSPEPERGSFQSNQQVS